MNTHQAVQNATYRPQFGPQFTFRDAKAIVPYPHDPGISQVDAAACLKGPPGSTHGMGLVLDFVPNHIGNWPGRQPSPARRAASEAEPDLFRIFDIDWMSAQQH